jgi:glycosyltransferase involved in cell wall biosynthesis
LIRAFVAAELGGAQLILTGGGQKNSSLPGLIEELHAEFNVRLAGRVSADDLRTLYHLATGMIFPSRCEAWSASIMEAMACGCPVAGSELTSTGEQIGDAGLVFSPDDINGITDAMHQLAGDTSLRQTLAKRSRERAKTWGPQPFLRTISAAYEHAQFKFRHRKAA